MPYGKDSLEGRFLAGDLEAYGIVARWVAQVLTLPRFRLVRTEWADLHQEVLRRIVQSLRLGHFNADLDLRVYVQGIARYTAREVVLHRLRAAENGSSALSEVEVTSHIEEMVLSDRIVKTVMGVTADQPYIPLGVRVSLPPAVSDGDRFVFTIHSPGGGVSWTQELSVAEIRKEQSRTWVVGFLVPAKGHPPGRYVLKVSPAGDGSAPLMEIPFEIAR